ACPNALRAVLCRCRSPGWHRPGRRQHARGGPMDGGMPNTPRHGRPLDDAAIAHLLHFLATEGEGDGDRARAYAAAQALARGGAPGIAALAKVMRNWGDYGPSALFACIQALGDSDDPRAAGPLREVIRLPPANDQFWEAFQASKALARLGATGK